MYEWIVKISAAAVALGAVGYILPKGTVKNAAMVSLSFLFLTVLMLPLNNFASNLLSEKTELEIEKNLLLEQTDDSSIFNQIMEKYKTRIEEEICKAFDDTNFECTSAEVSVDENDESQTFGEVLSIFCHMSYNEKAPQNTIEEVTIPEITIDWDGVKIENGESKNEETDLKKYESQIKEIVSELTGADYDRINIRWE